MDVATGIGGEESRIFTTMKCPAASQREVAAAGDSIPLHNSTSQIAT